MPADRFEAWAEGPRARAHARYVALLKAAGDWERVLDLDETGEEAHRALMKAQAKALFLEAAHGFAQYGRVRDESGCRAAANSV